MISLKKILSFPVLSMSMNHWPYADTKIYHINCNCAIG